MQNKLVAIEIILRSILDKSIGLLLEDANKILIYKVVSSETSFNKS